MFNLSNMGLFVIWGIAWGQKGSKELEGTSQAKLKQGALECFRASLKQYIVTIGSTLLKGTGICTDIHVSLLFISFLNT